MFYILAILAGPLLLLMALGALALVLALLAVGFVVTIPATAVVLFGLSIYLQVEAIWSIPRALTWASRWLSSRPDSSSTATELQVEWSSSVALVDRQLLHEIGYQLEAISSQGNEFFGLVAFGTGITAAAALSGSKYVGYWGSSFALIAIVAIVGGYALSRYRFHSTELSPITQTVVASALGLVMPQPNDLRVDFFKIRLGDSRTNAVVIEARRRILLGTRAIMASVVVVLGVGIGAQVASESAKGRTTPKQETRGHHGKAIRAVRSSAPGG